MKIKKLLLVTVFKNVINDSVISSFIEFLNSVECDNNSIEQYSDFIYKLYNANCGQNLYTYLKRAIYKDENLISKNANKISKDDVLYKNALFELSLFDELLTYNYEKIIEILKAKDTVDVDIINNLPQFKIYNNEKFNLEDIISSYKKNGYGIYSEYKAFKFNNYRELIPVEHFNVMTFTELKNYKYQQEVILKNTKAFVEGKEANNILLYGDRGCGKSSTVKALINEFSSYNLKIIQITKESFIYLSDLYDKLRTLPNKFIIFADDISFEENDKNFSEIKAVLEGSLSDKPSNTIIYATTNRMHLVKESFSSREGSELHLNDTIDEIVSLSDRFGIMLTFSSLTKNEYLDIVKQIAQDLNIEADEKLYKEAEMFAALKAIRTPRVARQFLTDYIANL